MAALTTRWINRRFFLRHQRRLHMVDNAVKQRAFFSDDSEQSEALAAPVTGCGTMGFLMSMKA